MTPTFADTSFLVAFLSPRDAWHHEATRLMESFSGPIVTTEWVLVELGNWFAKSNRKLFADFTRDIESDTRFGIMSASSAHFEAGLALYSNRPDKDWSFVDCISFAVMWDRGISDALTADHHFKQAGFRILLK